MKGLAVFLISSSALTLVSLIVWYRSKRKEDQRKLWEKIRSSPDTSWKKVGKVKEIFYYPLKSGKGKPVSKCSFERYGIAIHEHGVFTLRDRMFMVYDTETRKFITGRQHPELLLVNLSAVDENRAKLEVPGMPTLIFDLPRFAEGNSKPVDCVMWFDESVKCIDCGPNVATWLSEFLDQSNLDLRLGMCTSNSQRDVQTGGWEEHARIYNRMRNEDVGLFSDLASYMLMSESSVADLNERLSQPIKPLQLRPNVVVEGCDPFAEDSWEWIKIGEQAVLRNFKSCTRCTMVRIDPETGVPNPNWEPLKTLRSYRKLNDPVKSKLEDHAPAIGIYCGLYRSGAVELEDDVSVYIPND